MKTSCTWRNLRRYCGLLLVAALCLPSTQIFAEEDDHDHDHEGHGDVLLTIDDETGELATGSVENQTNILELEGTSVYESELQGIFGLGAAFDAELPGFSSGPAGGIGPNLALPANTDLEFEFLHMEHGGVDSNLLFWDISGVDPSTVDEDDVSFVPATGNKLTLSQMSDPSINAVVDGAGSDVDGFVITTTDSAGALHKDISFELSSTAGGEPDPGIYLWKMEFELGAYHADPIYWIGATVGVDYLSGLPPFDHSNINGSDAEEVEEAFEEIIEAAEHYVGETFAGEEHDHDDHGGGAAVPEPSTLAMTLMGLIGAFACVRRRRNLK